MPKPAHMKRQKKISEIFIISSVNVETVSLAAKDGNKGARRALICADEFAKSGGHCLHCPCNFTLDNAPAIYVVILQHLSDEARTAGFCIKCVLDGSYLQQLKKLGIGREALMLSNGEIMQNKGKLQ
jgi:hypothetical protein